MDTARWKHCDEFPVLDLVAQFRFRSQSGFVSTTRWQPPGGVEP